MALGGTIASVGIELGLSGVGPVIGGLDQVNNALGKTGGGGSGGLTNALGGIADMAGTAALAVGGVGVAAAGWAVKNAMDFQSTMAGVGAVSGATADQMGRLSQTALQLGQDTTLTGVGAADAANAMQELAKSGMTVEDIIGGGARGALLLASAGGLDFATAATIASDAMNQFGLSGKDIPHIADLFAAAANASALEVADLGLTMKYVGPIAHAMGQSIEETTGVIAELGAQGVRGEQAGTSLRAMLVSLADPTKAAKKEMADLGISVFDSSGHMKDWAGIATELHDKMGGLTEQQRAAALATIFGTESLTAATIIYQGGGAAVEDWTTKVEKAGSAADLGAARNKSAAGSLEQFKSSMETLGIVAGTALLPALTKLADKGTELLNMFLALDPQQQQNIEKMAAGAVGFLLLAGAANKTYSAFKDVYDITGSVVDAFGKKEAAKKSLTAANGKLAESAGKTAGAFGLTGAGAVTAAIEIGSMAAVTVAAGAGIIGLIAVADGVQQQFGEQNDIVAQNATRWDAAALAMNHGATEQNGLIDGFQRYLSTSGLVIADQQQLAVAWNNYVAGLQGAMISTDGVTRAFLGTLGPMNDVNQRLGMGRNELAQYTATGTIANETVGRLSVGAAALGAAQVGVEAPTRATGAALAEVNTNGTQAQRAMNDNASAAYALALAQQTVAPTIGYTALGMKDVDYYGTAAQTRMNETATAAYAAATAFDTANKSLSDYSKQGSQLQGYKTTLQKEFDDLIAKRDGAQLADVDQKRLTDDQAQLRDLDAKSGKGPLSAADEQRRKDLRAEIAGLQAKVKAGVPLSAAETARLNVIAPEIDYLNAQQGANAADTNQATSNAVEALINKNNANSTANAANNAAAQAPPAQLGTPGGVPKDFAPPINASDISKYDEFGQLIQTGQGTSVSAGGTTTGPNGPQGSSIPQTGGEQGFQAKLDQAIQAASQPRTINITVNGVTPKDIATEIYNELEPLLGGGAGSGGGATVGFTP